MGNVLGGGPEAGVDANTLASGLPAELNWEKLITHVFKPSHRPLLVLTSDVLGPPTDGASQPFKVLDVFRISEERSDDGTATCTGVREAFSPGALGGFVGLASQKGNKNQPNQDSAFYLSFVDGDGSEVWLGCVMDGHGPMGHVMSRILLQWLPLLVLRDPAMATSAGCLVPLDPQQVLDGLTSSFARMGEMMLRASSAMFERKISGSTCSMALCARGLLNSANVGDSRVVLGEVLGPGEDDGGGSLALRVDARPLTRDHKPEDPEERQRIESQGGIVKHQRVYLQEWPYVGLNLSRSFGDLMVHKVGVSQAADVAATFLDGREGQFVLVASDGVWEFLSNSDAVQTVAAQMHSDGASPEAAQQAVLRLVQRSMEEWRKECEDLDDITALLVRIPAGPASERRSPSR